MVSCFLASTVVGKDESLENSAACFTILGGRERWSLELCIWGLMYNIYVFVRKKGVS